jgi:hypothetical protein
MGRRVKLTCCKAGVENSPALAFAPRQSSEGIKPEFGRRVGQKKSGGSIYGAPSPQTGQNGDRYNLRELRRTRCSDALGGAVRLRTGGKQEERDRRSKPLFRKGPARSRLKIFLECERLFFVRESDIRLERPRRIFRGVRNFTCIVLRDAAAQIVRHTNIVPFEVLLAPENIDVFHAR